MALVVWRVRALGDVSRIIRFIAADNPSAAARVARALIEAGDSLSLFPERGRPGRQDGIRELVAVRPYVIAYRLSVTNDVTILRIWHAAQDKP